VSRDDPPPRTRWTDDRLDDREEEIKLLKSMPQAVAVLSNRVDEHGRRLDHRDEDAAKLHERIDAVNERDAERDREYRRNVILALGPLAIAALGIFAKVVLHV
jgi:hypothetical protein